jgi:lipopolysaccharide transport system permease protein
MLALSTGLTWGLLACPALLVLQLALVAGLGWLVAGVSVFLRDVPNVIGVALMIAFYLTPVFYARSRVPERFRWVIDLNPMTTIIEAYRSLLLGTPGPGIVPLGAVAAASIALVVLGQRVFARLAPRFADHL